MTLHFNRNREKGKRRSLRVKATLAEKHLWQRLRNRQLNGAKFRRQYSVDAFVLDFYCPAGKLAIEVDGGYHLHPDVQDYARTRQRHIEKFGIRFLRFTNEQVLENTEGVLAEIGRALDLP